MWGSELDPKQGASEGGWARGKGTGIAAGGDPGGAALAVRGGSAGVE
jgi:hypothetical protein